MEFNERRVLQHLKNFEKAISGFSNTEPLARYLTRFFKDNKQMGSSDRRMTSRFCYNYYRLGNALPLLPRLERLLIAEFLCEQESDLIKSQKPELLASIQSPIHEKLILVGKKFNFQLNKLFPLNTFLSEGIDSADFFTSHLTQPDLFIRVQRGQEVLVTSKLEKEGVEFRSLGEQTLVLPNGSKLQNIRQLNGLYEVQDLSSQQTIEFMEAQPQEQWWDCCAASGGKSLMFLDKNPKSKLLVSDIRLSILRNLDERFIEARIKQPYRKKVLDLTNTENLKSLLGDELFDGIIVDAPCSGSGTWGRTPEMMQNFDEDRFAHFTTLQKQIVANVIPYLKSGKPLVYVTCSVYKAENEEIISHILQHFPMKLERMELIKGYTKKADSMFAARLLKS